MRKFPLAGMCILSAGLWGAYGTTWQTVLIVTITLFIFLFNVALWSK